MPLYDSPDDAPLQEAYHRYRWFPHVLEYEYGEREDERDIPEELNWLILLPVDAQFGLDDVECSLAYVSDDGAYRCTVWDVTGEDDRPWAVFAVDDYGVRLLPEYSVLDEDADEAELERTLAKATEELPDRLLRGEFDRSGNPVTIPEWLDAPMPEEDGESETVD